ncbi:MAG: cytochrome P460 family protein [Hyphomicrobiaceae bacterium]|nr:cytochrome P460 family protein [Hyphomicrobiaceae bacterium]
MRTVWTSTGLLFGVSVALAASFPAHAKDAGKADQSYAEKVWQVLERNGLTGTSARPGTPKPSKPPHGPAAAATVSKAKVGDHTAKVAVQHVYGEKGTSLDAIAKDPAKHLKAVNVMIKRKPGHDPAHGDWMWIAYDPKGKMKVPAGAKPVGATIEPCSDCHAQQKGQDYLYHRP